VDPQSLGAWVDLIWRLGLGFTVGCVVLIWCLAKGVLTWGWQCRALERERDEWRHAALAGTGILEKLVERVERHL
jgi:hypothetical protein